MHLGFQNIKLFLYIKLLFIITVYLSFIINMIMSHLDYELFPCVDIAVNQIPKKSGHLVQWHCDFSSDWASSSTEISERNICFMCDLDTGSVWIIRVILLCTEEVALEFVSVFHYSLPVISIFRSTFFDYLKGLTLLKKYQWWCQVTFCFIWKFCELGRFRWPWLLSNDTLLYIFKL